MHYRLSDRPGPLLATHPFEAFVLAVAKSQAVHVDVHMHRLVVSDVRSWVRHQSPEGLTSPRSFSAMSES